jgi:hypothetical protein
MKNAGSWLGGCWVLWVSFLGWMRGMMDKKYTSEIDSSSEKKGEYLGLGWKLTVRQIFTRRKRSHQQVISEPKLLLLSYHQWLPQ